MKSLLPNGAITPSETAERTSTPARQGHDPLDDTSTAMSIPGWKRGVDLGCLCLALPAVLLLMLLIAVMIKMVSPGPVLFRQERVGYRRQRFTCLKFRTMKTATNTTTHERHVRQLLSSNVPMAKLDEVGDPRLIPLGRMLRASGLDELPQLINVWRGEMSLVGPRPCTTYEFEAYPPQYHDRFAALPGLTGLWQVSGKNKVSFTEMIELDIRYARHYSPGMDLRIMAKTVSTLISQVTEALSRAPARGRNSVRTNRVSPPLEPS